MSSDDMTANEYFLWRQDLGHAQACRQLHEEAIVAQANRARSTKRPLIVAIAGPSGVGKSSLSVIFAAIFGIRTVVSTDTVRGVAATAQVTAPNILSYFSHECWQVASSSYSPAALTAGFVTQCQALRPYIEEVCLNSVRHVQNAVLEGTHLIPKTLDYLCSTLAAEVVPLCILTSPKRLAEDLLVRRSTSTYMHRPAVAYKDRLGRLFALNAWWREEVCKSPYPVIENDCDAKTLLDRVVNAVVHAIGGSRT